MYIVHQIYTVISWHSNNMLACQWVNNRDSRVFSVTEFTFANKTKFKKLTTTLKRTKHVKNCVYSFINVSPQNQVQDSPG